MNNMHKPLRTLISSAVLGVLMTQTAHSGGFSLYTESSALAIGNYAAGVAAEAADASTGWYNPAGLVLLGKKQAVFGGVGVFPSSELTGTSTYSITIPPLSLLKYQERFNDIQGGTNAFVPSFHYAQPLGENAAFGVSVVSPFGLATDWGITSPVRYEATFTELLTANISPELAARVSEHFSLGAALDLQYARVKFNQMIGVPPLLKFFNKDPMAGDTLSDNKGQSYGVGFHAGIMGLFHENHTRLGLNYQSKMRHQFHGRSRLSGPLATAGVEADDPTTYVFGIFQNNNLSSDPINLPDVVTLSAYHDLTNKWALLGSVVYTGWSALDNIVLNNVAAPAIALDGKVSLVSINKTSPQNYSDAWRFSVGANYHVNEKLMLRAGTGYDATPTNNINRDVRLPDADRWALAVGAHYQPRANIGVDVGYAHLFVNDTQINRTDVLKAGTTYNVNATAHSHVDLVGAQLVWAMDGVSESTK